MLERVGDLCSLVHDLLLEVLGQLWSLLEILSEVEVGIVLQQALELRALDLGVIEMLIA